MKRKGRRLGFLGNGRGMGVQEEGWVGGKHFFLFNLKVALMNFLSLFS
jgi:hypothetical protein